MYLPRSDWRHVISLENPADLASRSCSATQLLHSHLWWSGINLAISSCTSVSNPPEKRSNVQLLHATPLSRTSQLIDIKKHSCFQKVLRILAFVHRFFRKITKRDTMLHPLLPNNLSEAKFLHFRHDQQEQFKDDLIALQRDTLPPSKSRILNLTPLTD